VTNYGPRTYYSILEYSTYPWNMESYVSSFSQLLMRHAALQHYKLTSKQGHKFLYYDRKMENMSILRTHNICSAFLEIKMILGSLLCNSTNGCSGTPHNITCTSLKRYIMMNLLHLRDAYRMPHASMRNGGGYNVRLTPYYPIRHPTSDHVEARGRAKTQICVSSLLCLSGVTCLESVSTNTRAVLHSKHFNSHSSVHCSRA
jgi:hypothetical protein